jgi:hypothetical protein
MVRVRKHFRIQHRNPLLIHDLPPAAWLLQPDMPSAWHKTSRVCTMIAAKAQINMLSRGLLLQTLSPCVHFHLI